MKLLSTLILMLATAFPSLAATTWPAGTNTPNQTFFGTNTFLKPLAVNSVTSSGIFTGNGGGLTNLNFTNDVFFADPLASTNAAKISIASPVFNGVTDPSVYFGFNVKNGTWEIPNTPATWMAIERNYYDAVRTNSEWYIQEMGSAAFGHRPIAFTWNNNDARAYCLATVAVSTNGSLAVVRNTDNTTMFSASGLGNVWVGNNLEVGGIGYFHQNLGVGVSPSAALHVRSSSTGPNDNAIRLDYGTTNLITMQSAGGGSYLGTAYVSLKANGTEVISLFPNYDSFFGGPGKFGIGTTAPANKLSVNGDIGAMTITLTNNPTFQTTNAAPAGYVLGVTLPVVWFAITNSGNKYLIPGFAP